MWRAAMALGPALLLALPASAQEQAPQPCEQQPASADYGAIRVGSVVVPQRHRFVGGDPNWDARMARWVGRVARVTRLSGVDDRGCPGVRLEVDGGRWFWRVRDLNVGAATSSRRRMPRAPAALPQQCGMSDHDATFGPLRVGSVVVLGRHRPVGGDANWSPSMTSYVGRSARIAELTGVDDRGCPAVEVDADGRQFLWRVRDLTIAEEGARSYRPGLASDHGRPSSPPAIVVPDERVPQECGLTDATAVYAPVEVGTEVELRRHRAVDGAANWIEEMEAFVDRSARVIELVGVDEQGCALVHVDADDGEWFWRLRDLRLR